MAFVTKGKYKGEYAYVRQWCNDWVSVDIGDVAKILSPTSLQFSPEEFEKIMNDTDAGIFHNLFAPMDFCRFKRRKRH